MEGDICTTVAFITDLKVLEVVEVRSAVTCWLLEHGPPRNTNFQLKIENLFSQYIAVSNPAPLTLNVKVVDVACLWEVGVA